MIKQIIRIGLPLILINIIFSLTGLIDNISLGIWGTKDSIAIALYASRLYWLCLLFVLLFPTMFGFLVAQYYGAKQYENEKKTVAMSILFSTSASMISAFIILVFGRQIISIFVKPGDNFNTIVDQAHNYVKVFVGLILLEGIIQSIAIGVTAEGKMKPFTIIVMLAMPLNFLLNFIFMKIFNMGTIGCAWSTLVTFGLIFIAIFIWAVIASKKNQIHFGFNPIMIFQPDKIIIIKAMKRVWLGFGSILTELSVIISLTIFTRSYKDAAVAIAMINSFFNLILFAGIGIAATKSYFVGKELGAGRFKQAYENDVKLNWYSFIFAIFNAILLASLAIVIPKIYISESAAHQKIATQLLWWISLGYPFGVIGFSLLSSLSVGGKGFQKFIGSSLPMFLLEVIMLFFIIQYTSINFTWAYFVYRMARGSKFIFVYWIWRRKDWIDNETGENENAQNEIILDADSKVEK